MGDLISREAAIDILCRLHIDNIAVNGKRITEFIRELPSVTDTNVGGKWIPCSGCTNCQHKECKHHGKV